MAERAGTGEPLILSSGTQVVVLREVLGQDRQVLHPRGAAGVIVKSPSAAHLPYRIRFLDGVEDVFGRDEVVLLARYRAGDIGDTQITLDRGDLFDRVIYRCVIGSRAYGLDDESSDVDYRGIYLPPADLHWSLYGVPDQIECDATQEHYWELQRFIVLALKANPGVLECLYTPLVEFTTPLAEELIEMRTVFLSRMVYQTYSGYVMSQFKKMQRDLRNQGQIKWKHAMHLIRLLISGISVLRDGFVPVRIEEHRDDLLAIRRGEIAWSDLERWRLSLHADFDRVLAATSLPERPDYEAANAFLIKARRACV